MKSKYKENSRYQLTKLIRDLHNYTAIISIGSLFWEEIDNSIIIINWNFIDKYIDRYSIDRD
jgi:hypothetical protein